AGEVLEVLGGWVQGLGDYAFKPLSIPCTSSHLQGLLRDKGVLLVVDDAWDPEPARSFLAAGPRCHILLTTRRADVADQVGAQRHELDKMSPAESLALLSARVGRRLAGNERADAFP